MVIILAAVIAGVSAVAAVIGAVVANRSALAVMKSTDAAMMSAQRTYGGRLRPPPVTYVVNQKIDWAKSFIEAADAPLGTVLTILFSIALGLGLSLLLSRSNSLGTKVATSKPTMQAGRVSLSALPSRSAAAATPPTTLPISAPPPPPPAAAAAPQETMPIPALPPPTAASDHNEIAGLLARGRAYLSDGDVASARVFLRRAAERNDRQAALALGETYDPAELRHLPNFQSQADPAKAREWYRRAADLGSAAAASRLDQLSETDR